MTEAPDEGVVVESRPSRRREQLDRFDPIGTPGELAELRLDPGMYFSCSQPTQGNRGCKHWGRCTMAFKGKEGQAPEMVGVYRESWQSEAVKTGWMPCHRYYDHLDEWKQSKDTVTIIGQAGEQIAVHETREDPRETQTHMGRQLPICKHVEVRRTIPHFVRPKDVNTQLMSSQSIKQELVRLEEEKTRQKVLGTPGGKDGSSEGGSKRR